MTHRAVLVAASSLWFGCFLAGCAHVVPPAGAKTPDGSAKVASHAAPAAPEKTATPSASDKPPPAAGAPGAPDDADEAEEGLDDATAHEPGMGGKSVDPDDMEEFDGTMLDLHDGPNGGSGEPTGPGHPPAAASPLAKLSPDEIKKLVKDDIGSLGPLSLGVPNHGRLVNGMQMPAGEHWTLTDPGDAWGTPETVDNLKLAIEQVNKDFANTPKMVIGHISAQHGGHLRPHKSHQQGRDVDISYFYKDGTKWYAVATEDNLDKPRTWAFVKTLVKQTPVEMIFIDSSIQRMLKEYALSIGEDPKWIDQVFQVGSHNPSPIVRHVAGHATHIHIRFWSPIAQASARIAAPYLPRKEQPEADDSTMVASNPHGSAHMSRVAKQEFILHRARSGDTLDSMARHYGVSVKDIQDANGLTSNHIKEKTTYRIPKVASTSSPGAVPHGGHTAKQRK